MFETTVLYLDPKGKGLLRVKKSMLEALGITRPYKGKIPIIAESLKCGVILLKKGEALEHDDVVIGGEA